MKINIKDVESFKKALQGILPPEYNLSFPLLKAEVCRFETRCRELDIAKKYQIGVHLVGTVAKGLWVRIDRTQTGWFITDLKPSRVESGRLSAFWFPPSKVDKELLFCRLMRAEGWAI